MQSIPTAQKKEFQQETPNSGKFIVEPLYPGYGLTLGNALRRVLLSSLTGVAISSIRIKGAEHEFSSLDGVKEDVLDIILNLKQVRLEVPGDFEEPIKLEISVKGEKKVTAGDFKKVAGVKVANPDLVLATVTDPKSSFELEAWVERGRGYLPTEMVENKDKEMGVIDIDAIFSPIKRVAIDVENIRVGEMTNWDQLIITLETDGCITPQEAFDKAVEILAEQFEFLKGDVKAKSTSKKKKEESGEVEESKEDK